MSHSGQDEQKAPLLQTVRRIPRRVAGMRDIKPGMVLSTSSGPFLLFEKMGEGGAGIVFKAAHIPSNSFSGSLGIDSREFSEIGLHDYVSENVAREMLEKRPSLCVLKLMYINGDPMYVRYIKEMVARMRQEARCYDFTEGHPCIPIQVVSGFEPLPYIALQLFKGDTLANIIDEYNNRGRRMPWSDLYTIFLRLLPAIELIHDQGIVHRDLKPEKIIIDNVPGFGIMPRVIDFGIAKFVPVMRGAERVLDTTETRRPAITANTGGLAPLTPQYAPPEQFESGAPTDQTADIYALGVILYELATGSLPHRADTMPGLLAEKKNRPQTIIHSELGFAASKMLNSLIAHCLEFDTHRRPQAVRVLYDSLQAIEAARIEEVQARRGVIGAQRVPPPREEQRPRQGVRGIASLPKKEEKKVPWKILALIGFVIVAAGFALAAINLLNTN